MYSMNPMLSTLTMRGNINELVDFRKMKFGSILSAIDYGNGVRGERDDEFHHRILQKDQNRSSLRGRVVSNPLHSANIYIIVFEPDNDEDLAIVRFGLSEPPTVASFPMPTGLRPGRDAIAVNADSGCPGLFAPRILQLKTEKHCLSITTRRLLSPLKTQKTFE